MIFICGSYHCDWLGTEISSKGITCLVETTDMTADDVYEAILEADAVVMHYVPDAGVGTELGLALAFGKMVYMVGAEDEPNVFVTMDGVSHFSSPADLAIAVAQDFKDELGTES